MTEKDSRPMEYSRWEDFATVIEKAKSSLALVQGESAAQDHFREVPKTILMPKGAQRQVPDARVYFAVRAREAELGALTVEELRREDESPDHHRATRLATHAKAPPPIGGGAIPAWDPKRLLPTLGDAGRSDAGDGGRSTIPRD